MPFLPSLPSFPRPLVSLTLAFAAGVLLAAEAWPLVPLLLFLEGMFLLLWRIGRKPRWRASALTLAFALLGCGRCRLDLQAAPDNVARLAPRYVTVIGMVASEVSVQPPHYRGASPTARFVLRVRGATAQTTAQAAQDFTAQNSLQSAAQVDPARSSASQGDAGRSRGRNAQDAGTLPPQADAGANGFVSASGDIEARVPLAPLAVLASASPSSLDRNRRGGTRGQVSSHGQDGRETPPDAAEPPRPRYGDILIVRGRLDLPAPVRNPGGFDYAAYLARRGIYATLTARRCEDWRNTSENGLEDRTGEGNALMQLAMAARGAILRHGRGAHGRERAGVLNGILLGDRGDLPGALNEDFERTGTSHVLATAGLHVGIVVVLLLAGLRVCRLARSPALLLSFAALILYALMAGGRPSVMRAVIMASVVLFGILLEREPDLPNTLAFAALLLLLLSPQNLFEPGFQFSFATVITIVVLMPSAAHIGRKIGTRVPDDLPGAWWLRGGIEIFAACFFLALASFIGSAPLVAYYSNDCSLISILANTFVVPILAVVIALGFGAALLAAVYAPLALPLDRLLDIMLHWILVVVRTCSAPAWACVPVASPPVGAIYLYYAVFWGVAWRWQRGIQTRSKDDSDGSKDDYERDRPQSETSDRTNIEQT